MIACVRIPHLATAIACQHDPALRGVPLLLVKHGAKRSKIAAVSEQAVDRGAAAGLSLSRARGMCPDGHFSAYDDDLTQRATKSLLETLWMFTNRVEWDETAHPQTGIFCLDLGSLNEDDAYTLGDGLRSAVEQQLETPVTVGLARGKFTAYAAATETDSTTLVTPREEAVFIAPLPVGLLPLSKKTARKLHILCIREIGQLAALPRSALVGQFGREGKLLYGLAHGLDSRPVTPRQMPPTETITRRFDDPIVERSRLDVYLHDLADELAARLEARSAALHEIVLTLYVENGEPRREQLHLLQPVTEAADIARTVAQLIDRGSVTQPIDKLDVSLAHLVPSLPRQLDLFGWRPRQAQLIDLAEVLTERHGRRFYTAIPAEPDSLLPERRFTLRLLGRGESEAS